MKIGIIGSGNIGGTLTRRLTALGHEVRVANSRGPESLRDLEKETGATAVPVTEAAQDADLVVVTIPEKAVPALPGNLYAKAAPGFVVVDTGNYSPHRDGRIAGIEDEGLTESAWVARELGVPVVKAFNNIQADHLLNSGTPAGTPGRIALPVAGDDPDAKSKILALIDTLGFDPLDAGPLSESWRQQPGTPIYGTDLNTEAAHKALAAASPERPAELRG